MCATNKKEIEKPVVFLMAYFLLMRDPHSVG